MGGWRWVGWMQGRLLSRHGISRRRTFSRATISSTRHQRTTSTEHHRPPRTPPTPSQSANSPTQFHRSRFTVLYKSSGITRSHTPSTKHLGSAHYTHHFLISARYMCSSTFDPCPSHVAAHAMHNWYLASTISRIATARLHQTGRGHRPPSTRQAPRHTTHTTLKHFLISAR